MCISLHLCFVCSLLCIIVSSPSVEGINCYYYFHITQYNIYCIICKYINFAFSRLNYYLIFLSIIIIMTLIIIIIITWMLNIALFRAVCVFLSFTPVHFVTGSWAAELARKYSSYKRTLQPWGWWQKYAPKRLILTPYFHYRSL